MYKRTMVVILVALLSASPSIALAHQMKGKASWYGPGFNGKMAASGERFNQNAMTAAHKTLPFGTKLKVTNLDNGRTICGVKINDRGPYHGGRIIDFSKAVATKLGMIQNGTANVALEKVASC